MESAFDLDRSGLRFVRAESEAAYRVWYVKRSAAFARMSMLAALATWGILLVVGPFLVSTRAYLEIAALFGVSALPAFLLALATARGDGSRWMLPAQMLANTASGLMFVCMAFGVLDRPDLAIIGVITAAFYGFTVQPLRVTQAAWATLGYVAAHQVFAILWLAAGRLDHLGFAISSIVPLNTMLTGAFAGVAAERASRQTFRQEQIIAAQREALDRERERALTAERARDLSEALLRLTGSFRGGVGALAPGAVVHGRYRIVRTLGRGGMGHVYEVERVADGARFALKVLTGTADRLALARFAREAQIAAELHHENVVGAVDVGVTDEGTLYVVMELVTGRSLAAARDRRGEPAWALPILRDIAAALAALHARGIVHRDLKPANVLLTCDIAKVTDFGIAALTAADTLPDGESDTAADLTHGAIMGTPMYMAPELAGGADRAGPAADVFSFGVLAFELLADRHPYDAPPIRAILDGRTPEPAALRELRPELPAAVCELVASCLAISPDARPTAPALVAALARA